MTEVHVTKSLAWGESRRSNLLDFKKSGLQNIQFLCHGHLPCSGWQGTWTLDQLRKSLVVACQVLRTQPLSFGPLSSGRPGSVQLEGPRSQVLSS